MILGVNGLNHLGHNTKIITPSGEEKKTMVNMWKAKKKSESQWKHGNGTGENEAENDLISKLSYTLKSTHSDIFLFKIYS
jgi:alpha-galactosidase/6-phospho-beta-glucosidase family protein